MSDEITPEPEVTIPTEVQQLQSHYERSEEGRARNARIAQTAIIVALICAIVAGVAIRGWSGATNALETRNKAVQELTEQGQRQAKVDDCQDQAFAVWLDGVLAADDISAGVLSGYYSQCEASDGKTFRP